jgi:hypothetical protein
MFENYDFRTIKEDRKSLAAEVYPDFRIVIKAPVKAKDFEIENFIKRKTPWINKQLAYFKQFNAPENKIYESGSSALYLGRQYQVIIEKAVLKNVVKIAKNKIYILSSAPQKLDEINQAFSNWLIDRAQVVFNERLTECLKSFPDLTKPTLKIRKLNKRWGSYLRKHEIVLNPELIKAGKQSIDYVIYHELCHAYHRNHSEDFYNLLSLKMPNWKQVKENFELKLLSV